MEAMAGPLDGVKVIDLSQVVSGPLAAMLLADQGADVIKVEPLGIGDIMRPTAWQRGGLSVLFLNNNRGKRSLSIDLTQAEGRAVILDLVRSADVFIQNFRPGVCARIGVGYDALAAVNPDLIYVSISGFGPSGPYADRPVLDPVIQGIAGIVEGQTNPHMPFPDLVRNLMADKSSSLTAAQAIAAALYARERGAGGQHVEVPMLDSCLYFYWPDGMMDRTLVGEGVAAGARLGDLYSLTDCADGQIVYFAATPGQLFGVYDVLGHPEWHDDSRFNKWSAVQQPENLSLLGEFISAGFAEMTVDQAVTSMAAAHVPCGPVLTADEALVDPQVLHNDIIVEWEHPDAGTIRQVRPAARFTATPTDPRYSAAHLGEHNDEILAEVGRSPEQIAELRASDVIG
jgi:crotonobetainyl-CoA:carnitine CoA-transferase CaiB-like acyl-CoA transferase